MSVCVWRVGGFIMSGKSSMLHGSIVETRPECAVTNDVFKCGGKRSTHPTDTHHISHSLAKKSHGGRTTSISSPLRNKTRREKRGTEVTVNVSPKKMRSPLIYLCWCNGFKRTRIKVVIIMSVDRRLSGGKRSRRGDVLNRRCLRRTARGRRH